MVNDTYSGIKTGPLARNFRKKYVGDSNLVRLAWISGANFSVNMIFGAISIYFDGKKI